MTFNINKSKVKKVCEDDNEFFIKDGITLYPRAGFTISKFCPSEYEYIINEAHKQGWIKQVAYVTEEWFEKEKSWNKLAN